MKSKIELLNQKLAEGKQGGGKQRIQTQHKKGKLTAREVGEDTDLRGGDWPMCHRPIACNLSS